MLSSYLVNLSAFKFVTNLYIYKVALAMIVSLLTVLVSASDVTDDVMPA